MNVSGLIEMLRRCPWDMEVVIAYDSLVCVYDIEEATSFIVPHVKANFSDDGAPNGRLYLCAMHEDTVNYHREDEGGLTIEAYEANQKASDDGK